jgi:hypothetical protein
MEIRKEASASFFVKKVLKNTLNRVLWRGLSWSIFN